MRLASYRFNKLESIWKQKKISMKTKGRIYKTMVMSTLLYGAESWACTDKEYIRLNSLTEMF